jgi:hypothetical protein
MTTTDISAKGRERYARARARGRARVQDPSSVVDVRYDSDADAIELAPAAVGSTGNRSCSGARIGVEARAVVVLPAGDGLAWGHSILTCMFRGSLSVRSALGYLLHLLDAAVVVGGRKS